MAAIINTDYWNSNLTTKNNTGMDFTGIGTAIGGIAGAIGTGIAANKNLKAVRETNAANLALARELNDWNLGLWYRENEYNSPVAKLGRLQAAGLNPLFYGLDGVANANQVTSANLANQEAPQMDVGAIGSAASNLTSSLFNAALIQIAKKLIALRDKELDIRDRELAARLPGYKSSAEKDTQAAKLIEQQTKNEEKRGKLMDLEYDNLVKDGKIKEAQAEVLKATKDLILKTTTLIEALTTTEKSKLMLNYALTGKANAETEKAKAETKTIDATRDDIIREMAAKADLTENEAKKAFEEIALIMAQTDKTKADAEIAKLQAKYLDRYGDAEHVAKIFAVACQGIEHLVDSAVKVAGAVATGGLSGAAQSATQGKSLNDSSPFKGYSWEASPNSPTNLAANPWLD